MEENNAASSNRYVQIIAHIFAEKYQPGDERVEFERSDITDAARELNIELPKNLGDVVYSFKYRTPLPDSVKTQAPEGKVWVIANRGRAQYAFEAKPQARIQPDEMLVVTKVPDATPGIVARYATGDEKALLTRLRYNRLIDTFTGVTCYPLQNHLRTTVPGIGQVETDELYVGVDKKGAHHVSPVQAKGRSDEIGIVQIEQDLRLCEEKFAALSRRAIAAQFMAGGVIALFAFEDTDDGIRKTTERHYRLVPPDDLTAEELRRYRERSGSS